LSSSTVKRWTRKFKNADFLCDDDSTLIAPCQTLGPLLQKFLDRSPFSRARVISRHLDLSPSTVKEMLRRELGLKKFNRRWVPHLLSDDQKEFQVDASHKVLSMLGMYAEYNFEGITTGEESWFQYSSCFDSMFAGSRENALPRIRRDISGQKTMVARFLTSTRLLVLEALPKGTKFNQEYFIDAIFPGLYDEQRQISCKQGFPDFSVYMDKSMRQNGHKVAAELTHRSIARDTDPSYSPDVSP
jgi:hypothetical protein